MCCVCLPAVAQCPSLPPAQAYAAASSWNSSCSNATAGSNCTLACADSATGSGYEAVCASNGTWSVSGNCTGKLKAVYGLYCSVDAVVYDSVHTSCVWWHAYHARLAASAESVFNYFMK